MDNSKETYNYFKLVHIVVNLVSEVKREVFKDEWDRRYTAVPWQDDPSSKHQFRLRQPPHGIADKIGQRNFRNLMNTSGDRKEWDITLLCYVLLNSKPINLKTTSIVGGVVDKLRTIRNDVMHIKEAKLSDTDFKNKYSQIKRELSKLFPLCQPYIIKLKNIKKDRLPLDIIADLKVDIAKEKQKKREEKFQKIIVVICSLLTIVSMAWIIYLLCVNFIPVALPTYFPEQEIPLYFHGRTNEIGNAVEAIISGTRVTVIYGSTGIGKKSTSLLIGKYIKSFWKPFPWFCVCYVPLYGVRDVRGMELQVLKSFYAETDVTLDNNDNRFMDLMTHRIKRKTLLILDGGPQLFVTDKRNVWKDLVENILDKNRNIQIIITALKAIHFVKHSVKTIYIKPLTSNESMSLMDRIKPGEPNEIKNTLYRYLAGSPVFIEMFMHVIKVDHYEDEVSNFLKLRTEPGNLCEALLVFLEVLDPLEDIFIRYLSLFPSKVSFKALISCKFYSELLLTSLKSKLVIKESVDSDERLLTLHPIFKMLPMCEREKQHPIELDIKINYCFNKHYISEARSIAEGFLSSSSMKVDILRILELEENLKIMLENGPSIDEYWQPPNFNRVKMPGEQMFQKEFNNAYISTILPRKYDGTHVYSLKKKYYNMLFDSSPLLTYGVSNTIFSKHVYKKAAMALDFDNDFDLLIKMVYSQSDKGDIYFFQHIYEKDDSIWLIEKYTRLLNNEERCEVLIEKTVKAICVFVVGRAVALYSQMKIVSGKVRSFKNVKKGLKLIDRSITSFISLNMNLTVAEAYSTKGLLNM